MVKITKEQYEEIRDANSMSERAELLAEYAGIETHEYKAHQYFINGGTFVGDSENYTIMDVLNNAGIEVE